MNIRAKNFFGVISWPLLLVALSISLAPSVMAQGQAETLCIQTFNAYGPAYSGNLEERTQIMGEELSKVPCEVVQLQEVWSEAHHQWAISALQPSIPNLSAARFDDFKRPLGGQSGLAIFTSEILTDRNFEQFKVNQDGLLDDVRDWMGVIKGVGSSTITLRKNPYFKFHMLNVHLHPSSVRVRIDQVVQLLESFERLLPLKHPVILTGDFNFKPDSAEYTLLRDVARLTDSYAATNGGYLPETCTYCAENPNHWPGVEGVIDYIWMKRGAAQSLTSAQTYVNLMGLHDIAPSDHYGLRSNMIIQNAQVEIVDQAEYRQRRQSATAAVVRALAKLDAEGSDEPPFATTRQKLTSLLNRLNTGNPSLEPLLSNLAIK